MKNKSKTAILLLSWSYLILTLTFAYLANVLGPVWIIGIFVIYSPVIVFVAAVATMTALLFITAVLVVSLLPIVAIVAWIYFKLRQSCRKAQEGGLGS